MLVVFLRFVFQLAAQKSTGQGANYAMSSFVSTIKSGSAACHCAHETTVALLSGAWLRISVLAGLLLAVCIIRVGLVGRMAVLALLG